MSEFIPLLVFFLLGILVGVVLYRVNDVLSPDVRRTERFGDFWICPHCGKLNESSDCCDNCDATVVESIYG